MLGCAVGSWGDLTGSGSVLKPSVLTAEINLFSYWRGRFSVEEGRARYAQPGRTSGDDNYTAEADIVISLLGFW